MRRVFFLPDRVMSVKVNKMEDSIEEDIALIHQKIESINPGLQQQRRVLAAPAAPLAAAVDSGSAASGASGEWCTARTDICYITPAVMMPTRMTSSRIYHLS